MGTRANFPKRPQVMSAEQIAQYDAITHLNVQTRMLGVYMGMTSDMLGGICLVVCEEHPVAMCNRYVYLTPGEQTDMYDVAPDDAQVTEHGDIKPLVYEWWYKAGLNIDRIPQMIEKVNIAAAKLNPQHLYQY